MLSEDVAVQLPGWQRMTKNERICLWALMTRLLGIPMSLSGTAYGLWDWVRCC